MTDTNYPSDELVRHWCALLDGELPPEQAARLMAEVDANPASKRFLEAQRKFNAAIGDSLAPAGAARLPIEIKLQIHANIATAARESSKPQLRLVNNPSSAVSQLRRIGLGWNLAGMAAMLIIGLTIGALAFAPTNPSDSGSLTAIGGNQVVVPGAPQVTPELVRLETFGGKANELMLNIGAPPDRIEAFAKEVGYSQPLPHHPGNDHVKPMGPVSIHSGTLDGHNYFAVTLCTGPQGAKEAPTNPTSPNECPTKGALQRVVVFIVDGNLKPDCASIDEKKCWKKTMVGHSYLARWDEAAKKTYLVYVPGNLTEDRMREIAEPLLLSASGSQLLR
jgi:hypothetical protein